MKTSFAIAALIANASAAQVQGEQIINGLLQGATGSPVNVAAACIEDVEHVAIDAKNLYVDVSTPTIRHLIDAVKEVKDLLKTAKQATIDCKKSADPKLDALIAVMDNSSSVEFQAGKTFSIDGKDIYADFKKAIAAYEKEDFHAFGESLGEAMNNALKGERRTQMTEVFAGMMKPYEGHFNIQALLVCIGDEDKALLAADAAYEALMDAINTKQYVEVIPAGILLFAAYQQAMQGLPACEAIDAAVFDIPTAATTLNIGSIDLTADVTDFVKHIEAGNFEAAGEVLGQTFKDMDGEKAVPAISNKEEVASIIQGMTKPFGGDFNIQALLVCIGDEDKALLAADAAYQALEDAISTKQYVEIIPAGILLFAAYQQAMQGLPACEAIDTAEWNKLSFMNSISLINQPAKYRQTIIEDAITNEHDIIKNAHTALYAYKAGEFADFGANMGQILKDLTENPKIPAKEDNIDRRMVTEMVQGFLEGANVGSFNFTALLICIYEADQVAEIIYEDVNIWEEAWADKDPMEAVEGVIAAVAAVQQLKQTIPVCESVDSRAMNWSHFDNMVSALWDEEKHMNTVDNGIEFNGQSITTDVRAAMEAFQEKDYKTAGFKIAAGLDAAAQFDNTKFLF